MPPTIAALYTTLGELSELLKVTFPDIQGAQIIVQLTHDQYLAYAQAAPPAQLPGEPFIEFSFGAYKFVLTSDEAMMLAAQEGMPESA